MSQISVDSVIPQSGTTITIGGSGDTVTLGSGASQSGFGSAAYAANASASTGAVNIDASDNLQFDSGYGSTATAYGCRAWVNFDGKGSDGIRGSGNVSSITDNAMGDYTINFSTAMPDANYATSGIVLNNLYGTNSDISSRTLQTKTGTVSTGSITLLVKYANASSSGQEDEDGVFVSIFR